MKRNSFLIATCLLIGLVSCSEQSDKSSSKEGATDTNNGTTNAAAAVQDVKADPNSIYLEGLYATSTQLPQKEYSIENIFDNDPATYWATMKGAGPDEGFMIYFKEETFVKTIVLKEAKDAKLAQIQTLMVYGNGSNLGSVNLGASMKIDKKLNSLYVRIKEVNNITTQNSYQEFFIEEFNKEKSISISGIEITGENGAAYKIVAPLKVEGVVTASSVLSPQLAYHPSQLFDSRKEFVWAEGAPGAGENEMLTFKFDQPVKIDALDIWNGFQRSDKHFTANARIKEFKFGPKGNTSSYTLKDIQETQRVELKEAVEGGEFEFKIISVYPGSSYKDAVLSELRFFNNGIPFVIKNKDAEKNVQALQAKTKGTILGTILDRRIKNAYENQYAGESSLILRSDYTFVMYDLEEGDGEEKEVIADGSWEIVELKNDVAKIRVFGKLVDLSQTFNVYQGNSSSSYLRIFQDFVTIDERSLTGEKFVKSFQLVLPDPTN